MDIYLKKLERIREIESRFAWLVKHDRKNWLEVAKLLYAIEKEELYLVKATSYTQYVKALALDNNVNISTLWRAKSAAVVFMEVSGFKDLEQIDKRMIRTTPEQLELYGKVRTIAPEKIVNELKERMLKGEPIRHELKSLWATYKPLKQGKTERGRKSKLYEEYTLSMIDKDQFKVPFSLFDADINSAISESEYPEIILDQKKRNKYHTTEASETATNIANALRAPEWLAYTLKQTFVARHQSFRRVTPGKLGGLTIQNQGNIIDTISIVRQRGETEATSPLPPLIFGASIKPTVSSLISDTTVRENASYCNYYYVAIPMNEDMILDTVKHFDRSIGIIAIGKELNNTKHELKVVRSARFNQIDSTLKNSILTELLLTNMNWQF